MAAEPRQQPAESIPLRVVAVLEPALEQLGEFAGLERGWDSYDAEQISPIALATTRGLLMLAAAEIRQRIESPARIHAAPLADGGVQLEWCGAGAELEIEVQADGTLGYLLAHDAAEREREDASVDEILQLIRDVQSGSATSPRCPISLRYKTATNSTSASSGTSCSQMDASVPPPSRTVAANRITASPWTLRG